MGVFEGARCFLTASISAPGALPYSAASGEGRKSVKLLSIIWSLRQNHGENSSISARTCRTTHHLQETTSGVHMSWEDVWE